MITPTSQANDTGYADSKMALNVFPSAASNDISISFQSIANVSEYFIDICNSSFETLLSLSKSTIAGGQQLIDLEISDLKPGNYLVRLVWGNESKIKYFEKI